MKFNINLSFLIIFILIFACSKKEEQITTLKKKSLDDQMIEVYNQAMEEFEKGDVIFAGKKFMKELLYPQSIWAQGPS